MKHCVLGIDPGLEGGVAVYSAERKKLIFAMDMPIKTTFKGRKKRREYDIAKLGAMIADAMAEYDICALVVEHIHSSPQMGVTSAFSFGEGFGIIRALCESLHPTVHYVSPAKWKARMILTSNKKTSVQAAGERFGISPWFTRISKDGPAEAAFIALYGATDLVEWEDDPLS